MKDENIEELKTELDNFLKRFRLIKSRSMTNLIEEIKKIDNVVDVIPDEFDEIYSINVANLFTIKLKHYKGLKKFKLGNYIYVTIGEKRVVEHKKLLS